MTWWRDFIWRFLDLLERAGIRIRRWRVRPLSGPSGTDVTVELAGFKAGEPVTLTVGPGSRATHTDQNGRLTEVEKVYGEPGTRVPIKVVVGSGGVTDWTRTVHFLVTQP